MLKEIYDLRFCPNSNEEIFLRTEIGFERRAYLFNLYIRNVYNFLSKSSFRLVSMEMNSNYASQDFSCSFFQVLNFIEIFYEFKTDI